MFTREIFRFLCGMKLDPRSLVCNVSSPVAAGTFPAGLEFAMCDGPMHLIRPAAPDQPDALRTSCAGGTVDLAVVRPQAIDITDSPG
jgi:hypothetical protein